MAAWEQFRTAYRAGLPNSGWADSLARLEGLLDLAPDAALSELGELEKRATGSPPLDKSLIILERALKRDAGIPIGPGSEAALQSLLVRVEQGSASESERKNAMRLSLVRTMRAQLQKSQTLSDAEWAKTQILEAANTLFDRLGTIQIVPGSPVRAESIQELAEILASAKQLISNTSRENDGLPHVYDMTAATARKLADCHVTVRGYEDALKLYEEAASLFEKAGELAKAQDCQSRARDLRLQLSGSLDAAAAIALDSLVSDTPAADLFDRVRAEIKLSNVASSATDRYEAKQHADAAAAQLKDLGYPDPADAKSGADAKSRAEAAMEAWIAKATTTLQGSALLARLAEVVQWYQSIIAARFAELVWKGKTDADAVQALNTEVSNLGVRLLHEATGTERLMAAQLKRYFPHLAGESVEPAPSHTTDFKSRIERMRAIDDALFAIREECNSGQPIDALLAKVGELESQAAELNTPVYDAKTRLGRAYVLRQAGRGADLVNVARDARSHLLAGRAPTLASFAQFSERSLYLDSLDHEVMGFVMTGAFAEVLKVCENTIRDFEAQRYRVNSEYRQSALLSYVVGFYKWAAFAAFKLQRWDNMLDAIDLIKARSAIRNRLVADQPASFESDLQTEFDRVSAAFRREPSKALGTRRRQLWDLMSINRSQGGETVNLPELALASLQQALAEDEALIAYFWLSETVLLAVAVSRDRFHAERILLERHEVARIRKFAAFIQNLKSVQRTLDNEVARLGEILLPAFLRDFIEPKKRVIFSPHHMLHLFPFHAARWDEGNFIATRFAVRYVPNFSALLLPWNRQCENRVLAIGIGNFTDPSVAPLANVETDAAALDGFYRPKGTFVETILGRDATRARIEAMRQDGSLRKFRCLHFGTHGLSVFENLEEPLESGLWLHDGKLDAMDIAMLGLNAELAVLSACHSGQRAIEVRELGELPGDDIFGLQAALFRSGVRSILGTLWLVQTESASAMSQLFHRYFAETGQADFALQSAVKDYLTDPSLLKLRGIFYWAPHFISSIGKIE